MSGIAIAHKDYDTRGGGEVFVRRLAEQLDCPVYVGRRNQTNEPDDDSLDIRQIPLHRLERHMIDRGGIARTAAYMFAWQRASSVLRQFDTVVTSGNEPLWYVPPADQTVVAYTHSTPRFMYDLFPRRSGDLGWPALGFKTMQRALYQQNTPRPDLWVANSDVVARRLTRYHHVDESDIRVVYPPVNVQHYSRSVAETADYYLHLGRLAGHKRPGRAVDAFRELDKRLIVAGTGPEKQRLHNRSTENVEFTGFVSEQRKRELLAGAKALVYPPESEDFGMVPVEAMASGTPVIGVAEGFTQYQISDSKNGLLWDREPGALRRAVTRFERSGVSWSTREIQQFARANFGVVEFGEQMQAAIATAQDRADVQTSMQKPPRVRADGGDP